ncbi:MAG: Unknown protein [uncultured Sulfurovum sp.]|uniref:Uncharacterized protein n=1 Tax=uncultured Sulfurovum sp. TaxID=269237 RepID=A0A6S6TVC3_9BACT|nr:MAG: Unknown protein [uncultured Sulfurovum sp.]
MSLEEIEFELEMAGLSREQQVKMLNSVRRDGFDPKLLDRKLATMGFPPVFTIYDDEE